MTGSGGGGGGGGSSAGGSRGSSSLDAAYLCYVLLGAGTLFPWNALITAADYWEARYPGRHVDRLMTISYLPVNLVVIAAMVHFHLRVRPRLRILGGLLGFTLSISAVPLLDLAPASGGTLAAVLLLVAACGVWDGFAQGALFGEAARLPPRYTQALVAGTAVSGVVVSLLRVITKATLPDTEAGLRRSANIYFTIAALVCASCTVVYGWVLPRLPAVQQYRRAALEAALAEAEVYDGSSGGGTGGGSAALWKQQHDEHEQHQQQGAARPGSIDLELSYEDHQQLQQQDGAGGQQRRMHEEEAPSAQARLLSSGAGSPQHEGGGVMSSSGAGAGGGAALTATAVFLMIWRLAVANALIYTVTLSIFPGVLAEDVHSAELGSWYPVALLTAFNLADWAGKSVPGVDSLRLRNERSILAATGLRVLFVPAFHYAAVGGAGPAVIGLLAVLLGTSNGYLIACAMIEGPSAVPPAAAELAGNLMVLFLILGLCIGAACGFLWLL